MAQVIAIDPSAVACRLLRLHATLNDVQDRLRVVQAAVAAVDGTQISWTRASPACTTTSSQSPGTELTR